MAEPAEAAAPLATLLLANMWDVVHVLDAEGIIRYITPSIERLLGIPPEEFIGRAAADFVHPDDLDRSQQGFQEAIGSPGWGGSIELRLRRRDGSWCWVGASARQAVADGVPLLIVSTHDISGVKEAERSLSAAEERFRVLAEQSLVGIYIVFESGFLYVNPTMAKTFGYTQEEMLALDSPLKVVAEVDRDTVTENIRRRLEGEEETKRYRFRGIRKDGTRIIVEVHGTRAKMDGRPVILGSLIDVTERVRWEKALQESERRYRRFFEEDLTGDVLVRPDGRIIACNRAFAEMFGLDSPDAAIGVDIATLHPDPQDREALVRRLLEERVIRGEEVELRRRDGSRLWAVQNVVGSFDEEGNLLEIRRYLFDITDRKRAEEEVRSNEERLRLVGLATNDTIWDFDPLTGRVEWSDAAARLFRCPIEELGNMDWWYDRIHPDDRKRVVHSFQGALEGTVESWSEEYRLRRGNGSYITVLDRGHIVRNEIGAALRMVGSMLDVTGRKRQEEVQRFLAEASAVLDSSLEYDTTLRTVARLAVPTVADYCLIDIVDEQVGEVRRVAAAHADPTKESLLSHDYRISMGNDPRRHPVLPVIRTGESVLVPEVTEAVLDQIADGEARRATMIKLGLRSYMIVAMVARGRTLGTITLAADASSGRSYSAPDLLVAQNLARRAALAVDNARLYEEAREAVSARDDILAVVSHDLRNPLNTIVMSASLAMEDTERRAGNRLAMETIKRSAEHMNVLIQDLLDISRMEAGQLRLDPTPLVVPPVLSELENGHAALAAERSIRFAVEYPDDLPPIRADADRLRQAFSNLVGNAFKFTPNGGSVVVKAERREEVVCFSVHDSGPGIPAKHQSRIFDRFWQAKSATRQGAGLGLAITRGIVEAHGGQVWVESEEGRGATFHFTIPVSL